MKYNVYAQTGEVSINGKFEIRTWLAFFQGDVGDTDKRILLGTTEPIFPIQYPLILDNGLEISEKDYFRGKEVQE
jgi:hypothetical protein